MDQSQLSWITNFFWGIADDVLRDLYVRRLDTSPFTMRDQRARASQQQLKADFEAYLNGFSPNVQDILEKFEFRNQIPRLFKADALGTLIENFFPQK
jgi:type I restriction enzyme M protein